jgi:hypothetical protein
VTPATRTRAGLELLLGASLKELDEVSAELRGFCLRRIDANFRHAHALAWACLGCSFAGFLVLAALAWFYLRNGAATEAAWIFGSGSATILGLFVTTRFVYEWTRRPPRR